MVQLAGYEAGASITPREIQFSVEDGQLKPGGIVINGTLGIDGGNSITNEIRAGWLMGQITATGLWTPCKRTQVNLASATVTALIVDNSYPFVVGDDISVGADTGIEITAINYATHTLTIASTAVVDNEVVVAEDGSEICRGVLASWAKLRNRENDALANASAQLFIAGKVDQANLLGDVAAVIATASSHFLEGIQFWNAGIRTL